MWLLLKNLLYTLVVPGLLLGWIPFGFFARHTHLPETWRWFNYAALPIALAGALLYFSSLWQVIRKGRATPLPFDPPQKVLAYGPYSRTRNPMYLAFILISVAEALFFQRTVLWLYSVCLASLLQLIVVMIEEAALHRRFGALYSDYCNAVRNRWLPARPRRRY